MKTFLFIMMVLFFISCKKEYKYEVWEKGYVSTSSEDRKMCELTIKEKNDSLAFIKAHLIFITTMELRWTAKERNFNPRFYLRDHYYKLIAPDGSDISHGEFLSNPNELMRNDIDLWLSDKFKNYLKDDTQN
jgi:hypothetical protein